MKPKSPRMPSEGAARNPLDPQSMELVQVGRQPILDRNLNTYGYELLYREGGRGPAGMDGDQATSRTLLNTVMEIGVQHIAGPHKVFVNLTRTFFTHPSPLPLEPEQLVLEILEDVKIDDALLQGVRRLRQVGHHLAIDDYRFESHWDDLLPLVSMVKVDVLGLDLEAHRDEIAALRQRGLILLAEKVETQAEFELCRQLGFDLFQGYFFARPNVVHGRRLAENQTVMLRLLARINDPDCTIDQLEPLIAQDPKLSFKLLRYINSAGTGLPRQVESIAQAVLFVGLNRIRAWATLFIMAARSEKPDEILTIALVRARLCESLARALGTGTPEAGYTVGLLSVLDALTDQPMSELMEQLPLPHHITEALERQTGPYGTVLQCALALEACDWLSPAAQLLPLSALNMLLIDAMEAAEAVKQTLD
jgi:EAL and modified HD-GYP domain-containing signal transduction protein